MSKRPEAAGVHDHWTTDAEVGPEHAPSPAIENATLDDCGEFHLLRETGECLVKHPVVEHQWHERRDGSRHVMAESPGKAISKPVTP